MFEKPITSSHILNYIEHAGGVEGGCRMAIQGGLFMESLNHHKVMKPNSETIFYNCKELCEQAIKAGMSS